MLRVHSFTFNPFEENTYVLFDETKECVIIDPGCLTAEEQKDLAGFISGNSLRPVRLLNTHCHIDHVFGNRFVADKYKLDLEMHLSDLPVLHSLGKVSEMYGIPCQPSPEPKIFLEEGGRILFGDSELEIFFTPGHSPGHVVFYSAKENFVISGDVLFLQSIGRTDLPGGDYDTLIRSINEKLFLLADETKVFPGHGPATSIGHERRNNPFLTN